MYLVYILAPEALPRNPETTNHITNINNVDLTYAYVDKTRVGLDDTQKAIMLELALTTKHTELFMLLYTVYDVAVKQLSPYSIFSALCEQAL